MDVFCGQAGKLSIFLEFASIKIYAVRNFIRKTLHFEFFYQFYLLLNILGGFGEFLRFCQIEFFVILEKILCIKRGNVTRTSSFFLGGRF